MVSLNVSDSFTEFQMYVVFEFEDSGRDLETVEVSGLSICSLFLLHCYCYVFICICMCPVWAREHCRI